MNLFNMGERFASYNDPKVKKFRIIGDVLFFIGLAAVIITYFVFSKDVSEYTIDGVGGFFKPPILYLTLGVIVMVIGGIFSLISRVMGFFKSFKNGDNPILVEKDRILREKDRIEGEINQLKEEYNTYKEEQNQNNNNQ